MKTNVFILEDSIHRIKKFEELFSNKELYNVFITKNVIEAISIDKKEGPFNYYFLDHDLGLKLNGYDFAKYLSKRSGVKYADVFIHSSNIVGAKNIKNELKGKVSSVKIIPFILLKNKLHIQ